MIKFLIKKFKIAYSRFELFYKIFCTYIGILLVLLFLFTVLHSRYPNIITKDIFELIFFSNLSILTLLFIIYFFKQKVEPFKFNAFLFIFIYLMSMFITQLYIVSIWNIESFQILLCVFSFYMASLILLLDYIYRVLGFKVSDKLYTVVIGIIIYLTIIFDGSFLVFVYYTSKKYIDNSCIYAFNHTDFTGMLKILADVSVSKFFNYDSGQNIPSSFRIPYLIGKFLDSFLLAFIFSRLIASKPKETLDAELKAENEELRKENKLLRDTLDKKTRINSKLRKDKEELQDIINLGG